MQEATIAAAGRLLLAILFLLSGLSKLAAPAATTGYIASAGLPFPLLGYAIALGVELGGGLLLLTGWHVRIAENGATTHELMAIFGWQTVKEAERYTRAAQRKRLAGSATRLLAERRKAEK